MVHMSTDPTAPWYEPQNRVHAFRTACLVRGISAAKIADKLGVTRQAVSRVVRGEIRSARIEKALKRRFPDVFKQFPFGAKHEQTVARGRFRGNCARVQEVNTRTPGTTSESRS